MFGCMETSTHSLGKRRTGRDLVAHAMSWRCAGRAAGGGSERGAQGQRDPVAVGQADIAGATDHGLAHTGDVCVLTWAAVADIGQGHVVALVLRALDTELVAVLALAAAAGGGIARYAIVEAHRRGNVPAGEDAKPLWREAEGDAQVVARGAPPGLVLARRAASVTLALEEVLVIGYTLHAAVGHLGDEIAGVEVGRTR